MYDFQIPLIQYTYIFACNKKNFTFIIAKITILQIRY